MLTVALIAGGIVALAELFHRSKAGEMDGENVFIATYLAQRCQEELRNASFANLPTASCSAPAGFSRFTYLVAVTTPYTLLRQVSVTVSWNAPGGQTGVQLQTYRSGS